MAFSCQPFQNAIGNAIVVHSAHQIVEAKAIGKAHYKHYNKLTCSIGTIEERHKPTQDIEDIERNYCDRSTYVRKANCQEKMVQVTFVGMEGRYALHYAAKHYTHSIKHRNAQHAQAKCYNAHMRMVECHHRCIVDNAHTEYTHQHTYHHCARVAYKHLAFLSEYIVEEERDKRACHE